MAEYESGTAQVVVNVAVLTEGYDFTPTGCRCCCCDPVRASRR